MSMIQEQVVLITGASSGIGAACAEVFAAAGARLILWARRQERLDTLAKRLPQECTVLTQAVDVRDRPQVLAALGSLPPDMANIQILINNAGLSRGLEPFAEAQISDWEEMIDTNLKGLLYVTRAILPEMIARQQGHIINVGSIAAHQVYAGGHVYCATKAGVQALSQGLRLDLLGTPIRVTEIDPGMVATEFSEVRFHGDRQRAAAVYRGMTPLSAHDVAEVILFAATRPAHVNLNQIVLMPVDQASTTMVYRRNSE
ncbi:SDR family NAD(P)-dependent oxidoreductase [Parathermosynechococcus lividus]